MFKCDIAPVKITSYSIHDDYISVKIYHPTPRTEIIDFLKNLDGLAIQKTDLSVEVKGLQFYGNVNSINSKKNAVSFLIHTKKSITS